MSDNLRWSTSLDSGCVPHVQLPAGLIDEDETAADAAVRELKEETGYAGTVGRTSSICFSDPGLTNANMQVHRFHMSMECRICRCQMAQMTQSLITVRCLLRSSWMCMWMPMRQRMRTCTRN